MHASDTDTTAEAPSQGDAHAQAAPAPPGPSSPAARPSRRIAFALLCALHAPVFAWGAAYLPWRKWTLFAAATAALAALHAATAALLLVPHALAPRAVRALSFSSLAYLGHLGYGLLSSTVYIASQNRGLGSGVAAALLAVFAIAVLLLLPLAAWGLASTGGLRLRRPGCAALGALLAAAALGTAWKHQVAKADVMPLPGGDPGATAAALREALSSFDALPSPPPRQAPSLFTTAPAACAAPPSPGRLTVVLTQLARMDDGRRVAPATRCVQPAPGEDATAALRAAITAGLRGPLKLDVLSAVQPLGSPGPAMSGLSLRPGLDGICLAERCLMPWQLIALDAFNTNTPIPDVPDFRFGVDLAALRRALGDRQADAQAEADALRSGLLRVETLSYAVDGAGALHLLSRAGRPAAELTAESVAAAAHAAQGYILGAQRNDGMFR
jgi:hypothetical protein